MQRFKSRRKFLQTMGLVSAGIVLVTPDVLRAMPGNTIPFAGYNPHAEAMIDMRKSLKTEDHITVSGKVFSRKDLKPISNIQLEVWHLSPGTSKYRHQAKVMTNEYGEYQFFTDKPGKESGKSPRIFFRITGEDRSCFTELLIGEHDAYITGDHWIKNKQLGDLMQPMKQQSNINFNLSL